MEFNRRQAIQTVLLGGSLFAAGGTQFAFAANYRPSLFLLGGINPTTSPEQLFAALDPIVSQNIPVALVVNLNDPANGLLSPDSPLAELFQSLVTNYTGLVEFVTYVPDLAADSAYFKMRRVSEARAAFRKIFGPDAPCLSLATEMPDGSLNEINEVRAGGFRNLLLLPNVTSPAGFWETTGGVLQFYGGKITPSGPDNGPLTDALSPTPDGEEPLFVHLALPTNATGTAHTFELGASIGDALSINNMSGDILSTLPTELHMRSDIPYNRLIGLQVEGAPDPATMAFMDALHTAEIPFSLVKPADTTARDTPKSHICLKVPATKDRAEIATILQTVDTRCLSVDNVNQINLRELSEAGAQTLTYNDAITGMFCGLDNNGLFHAPIAFSFNGQSKLRSAEHATEDMLKAIGEQPDAVVYVTSAALQDPVESQSILGALQSVGDQNLALIISLDRYRNRIAPRSDQYKLLGDMKHRRTLASLEAPAIDDDTRTALMADALVAWRYFDRFSDPDTGLVPGAIEVDGDTTSGYQFATMWDVGTLLLALVSVHRLKIINDETFDIRARQILASIPTSETLGLKLPQASTSVTGRQQGELGFDATDAGRLLISLKVLEQYRGEGLGIPELVASWDIQATIENGYIRSIRNGQFRPPQHDDYTHYISRGLALWGFQITTPYPKNPADSETDAQMRVLETATHGNPVSSEPHVLEAVELGYSAPARTLADVLYTAQMIEFERSGKLVCVSEGPLNREPWFSYQGYQIGDPDPWKINTVANIARYQTAGFKRAVSVVSSKAAYLWLAARPQSYSTQLVNHVRDRGRFDDFGFASGIFTATGLPTRNYSDLNTNGIILEAIAYIIAGDKPLLKG